MEERRALLRRIRFWLTVFVVGLVLSGLTAFPLVAEAQWAHRLLSAPGSPAPGLLPGLVDWSERVSSGLQHVDRHHPFVLYGTDWLAFAHLAIAVAFYGPLRDPVRNVWVVQFGLIACAGVVPIALICGPIRQIPPTWMLVSASFGVLGAIPLVIVYRNIRRMEALENASADAGGRNGG
ncbi:hypothetical protein [Streptomonospora litoralis]|uniref:Cytoplasmic membrane protein n=1 Tax=Streptomonospora litoralis TaxID=2498135 RepID=A0A4P6Q574_9ACTN|nr:hypothetical protein [Streptomonospora litoralis]QBI55878.1 hypothetical protein EKD16_20595 [Streptomonospora litoralis]